MIALFALAAALAATPLTQADCSGSGPAEIAAGSGPLSLSTESHESRPVLRVTGRIDTGASDQVRLALQETDVEEVWLDSTGGDREEATKLSAVLRRATLVTRIPAGAVCAGACVNAFLGGIGRIVDQAGHVGIASMPVSDAASPLSPAEREQAAGRWAERQADHYIRSGISRGLLRLQLETPAGTTCWLTPAAQRRYNLTNAPLIRPASNPPPSLSRP